MFFDLKFPGYGAGGILGTSTDDGSTLLAQGVEIPGRAKSRVIIVRQIGERLVVVDDFVWNSALHPMQGVKLQSRKLNYYDDAGVVVRITPLP